MSLRVPNKAEYADSISVSAEEIHQRIKELGAQITRDYDDGLLLLCNQKASVVFLADLMREIDLNLDIEFLDLGSIKQEEGATPLLYLRQSEELILKNRDCIIITDVVRTGFTLHFLLSILKAKNPKSIAVCTLLYNPEQQLLPIELKYKGFETDYDSLCGYGIAYKGKGRQFKDIVELVYEDDE